MSGLSRANVSSELNNFVYGVSRRNIQNAPDLTKIGISLLKSFPAARDAVLEYFAMVFHEAVNISISQTDYENEMSTSPALEAVNMIGPDLCVLGEAWAPIVAPWCIALLKEIAVNKSNFSNVALQNSDPVRVLLDIATLNLTQLYAEERAKCIDMLLGSSECDWVIGHLGRVEPSLVVPRALQLGLESARGVEHAVGIVSHLPSTHSHHVRQAVVRLFNEAISEDSKIDKKWDIIPYLLNLAAKSDTVLKAITQDIDEIFTDALVDRLIVICPMMRNIPSWEGVGPSSLVSLLIRADINLFLLLLRHAKKNLFCRQLLEYLLQKLEHESLYPDRVIPLIESASEQVSDVRQSLLHSKSQLERYALARVLILVASKLSYEFVNTVSYILQRSRDDVTLALLVRIMSSTLTMHTPSDSQDINLDTEGYDALIKSGVDSALRESIIADLTTTGGKKDKSNLHYFCLNISKLLRWEASNRVNHLRNRPISRACEATLYQFGCAFDSSVSLVDASPATEASHAVATVLDALDLSGAKGPPPSVEVILKVVKATVKYFFRCLHEDDVLDKILGTQRASRLLRKICTHSKLARSVALRELLEASMIREERIFGSKVMMEPRSSNVWPKDEMLLHLNKKHGPITQLTQSHTSVFHAGIIGKGVRKSQQLENQVPTPNTTNIELLMGALVACMEGAGLVEGMTSVSLLLVELVSPDIMYNGLPWPDEDFTKQVSIERELYMRSTVEGCAVCRSALRRCGAARPALCYASALLRAGAATLLHAHTLPTERYAADEVKTERAALKELAEIMTLGQLLPHPLCHIVTLLELLTPTEIVQVLRDCIWNYTRDNVPSPALFTCDPSGLHWRDPSTSKPPAAYTDTLRLIIQKRIGDLGHLYPLMFLNLEKSEN